MYKMFIEEGQRPNEKVNKCHGKIFRFQQKLKRSKSNNNKMTTDKIKNFIEKGIFNYMGKIL